MNFLKLTYFGIHICEPEKIKNKPNERASAAFGLRKYNTQNIKIVFSIYMPHFKRSKCLT